MQNFSKWKGPRTTHPLYESNYFEKLHANLWDDPLLYVVHVPSFSWSHLQPWFLLASHCVTFPLSGSCVFPLHLLSITIHCTTYINMLLWGKWRWRNCLYVVLTLYIFTQYIAIFKWQVIIYTDNEFYICISLQSLNVISVVRKRQGFHSNIK